jgi:hypothetical protein
MKLGLLDAALTDPICSKKPGVYAWNVGSTYGARVLVSGAYRSISQYTPPGLAQSFSPSFRKRYSVSLPYKSKYYSNFGVGNEVPHQSQAA